MLDNVSLDQLRIFIAAADEGSFSAAGRRLKRAQSVVSQTIANLEAQLGVKLFDRSARTPSLSDAGQALLTEARAVASGMDLFKARAKGLAGGLEPELSVVVDVLFPITNLTCAVSAFQTEFPMTPLRLYVEALGAVVQPVLDGRCAFGVMGSLPMEQADCTHERLLSVELVAVASPQHALAAQTGPIPVATLAHHVQLVLTDRSELSAGRDFGVFSPRTWRLADLGAKHAFLRAGLGWGGMPLEAVQADLDRGTLVRLAIQDPMPLALGMPMSAVYRTESPPGPAGRWLIDRLKQGPVTDAAVADLLAPSPYPRM
jgi:DNA-binding transcriptional LysR family regulator